MLSYARSDPCPAGRVGCHARRLYAGDPTASEIARNSINLRGSASYRLQDYDSALENFDLAIRLDANRYETYFNRGLAKQQMTLLNEALVDFRYALRLNPEYDAAKRSAISIERRLAQLRSTQKAPSTGEEARDSGRPSDDENPRLGQTHAIPAMRPIP